MFFISIIAGIILLVACLEIRVHLIKRKLSKHAPGPPVLPLIGNIFHLGRTVTAILNNSLDMWYQFGQNNYQLWVAYHCHIVVTNVEDVENILSSKTLLRKPYFYDQSHPWLGEGLITSHGLKWQKRRKIIIPSFHFKILQEFQEEMTIHSNKFIAKLKEASAGERIFDFQEMVDHLTLDVICATAMGVNVNSMDNPDSELVDAFKKMCVFMYVMPLNPIKYSKYIFPLFPEYKTYCKSLKVLQDFTKQVIENRIKSRNLAGPTKIENHNEDFGKRKMFFLDNLLSSTIDGRPLNAQELYEEVSTFIFAGHDTTATAITFAIHLLSRHLGVQQKVYAEQQQIMQDNMKRDATYQELADMKYLDLVFKETERLYPSIFLIGRETEQEYNMNGKIIPKNCTLVLFLMAMGYNEKSFPDPYRFKPERFELNNRADKNPFDHVPFSAGPRNCIGQKFAQLEFKTVVSKIVRHFEILPPLDELASKDGYVCHFFGPHRYKNVERKYDPILAAMVTLKSKNGILIRLRPRNSN